MTHRRFSAVDPQRLLRGLLIGLLGFVALSAIVVGPLLIAVPDGSLIGLDHARWRHRLFDTFLVPGFLLTGLGGLHACAMALQVRRHPQAWFWTGLAASGLVVWIVVQLFLIQASFLQPLLLGVGATTGLLALVQWRLSRRSQ